MLTAAALALALALAMPAPAQPPLDREGALVEALTAAEQARIGDALASLAPLLDSEPPFHAAEYLHNALVGRQSRDWLATPGDDAAEGYLAEARARVTARRDSDFAGRLPDVLLQASDEQRYVVAVDLSLYRLFLFENRGGGFELVQHFYAAAGKGGAAKQREGDRRTPVGVYFLTRQIEAADLPEFYGAGALPVNYPNEWDLRQRRTGYGIWLHGVPGDTYSRAPRSSDGCIVLSNDVFRSLWQRLDPAATPVIIAERLNWVTPAELEAQRSALLQAVESWRRDWESLDQTRYARHYAPSFRSARRDRQDWLARKAQVHAQKKFLQVNLGQLSAYRYPGETGLAVVSFEQDYRSSNHDSRDPKRQYWQRGPAGEWRIVYEGTVRLLPVHARGIPASARPELTQVSSPELPALAAQGLFHR